MPREREERERAGDAERDKPRDDGTCLGVCIALKRESQSDGGAAEENRRCEREEDRSHRRR